MLISKTAKLKWSNKIKKKYIDKGYIYTGLNDEFEVRVEDLDKRSTAAIVEVKCDYCGEIVSKSFDAYNKQREKIKSSKDCCKKCASIKFKESFIQKYGVEHPSQVSDILEKIKQGERNNFLIIQEEFKKVGYELISTSSEYESVHIPLSYICPHHKDKGIQKISYNNLRHGKRCRFCSKEKTSSIQRLSGEFIYYEFLVKGYKPLFKAEEYINAQQLLPYLCCKHKNEGIKYISYSNLKAEHGCYSCFVDRITGDKNHQWNPNLTNEERIKARSYTEYYSWRKQVFERDDYTCQCCGRRGGRLNAHHLINYSDDVNTRLALSNGVTICKSDHILFHKTYGYKNNTPQQYEEFKKSKQEQLNNINISLTHEAS